MLHFGAGDGDLEAARRRPSRPPSTNVDTAADDICLIAFTSGTTGVPKGTMHFHRDVMAACACWPPHVLRATPDDVFIGSPPLAFTFGLGGLLLFPLAVGASHGADGEGRARRAAAGDRAVPRHRLLHRAHLLPRDGGAGGAARPALAAQVRLGRRGAAGGDAPLWKQATGIEIIDGIGSTELLHIFISADEAHARPGATGVPVPGYRACVLDDDGRALPPGQVGRLAVKGPTGCRYLADPRQANYVRNGWNLTGDAYLVDDDGQFVYQARTDDMIISGGYNIAGPEVEGALLLHPAVAECGVIGVPDEARGQIVKAFVVLQPGLERRRGDGAGAAGLRQADDRALQVPARRSSSAPACRAPRRASCSASSLREAAP